MPPTQTLSDEERRDRLRLIRSDNVGPVTYRQLLARYRTASAALEALPELARRAGGRGTVRVCPAGEAERELASLGRLGARLIALGEPGYPPLLAHIDDAPPLLAVLGDGELLARPAVAVVGARNGSANGARFTEALARDLGRAGLVVVSGLARGIDAAAHRGALDTGTIAVMAGGIDVCYPRDNEALYAEVAAHGVLLSEQQPGLTPQARHFPTRNRIVSGLALGVVVIEATLRSGSLITARLAGEQGREVLAVPGSPLDPRARGANKLIREGAALVESADDVLEALPDIAGGPARAGPPADPAPPVTESGMPTEAEIDEARERLAELLGPAPVAVDDILRRSGFPARIALPALMELELAGRLQRHPGGQVSLAFG